ncbi:hypothetical protein PVL29_026179 [Vitis rotundifolia]|uniref:Uncharacterized protein n=1 Tax=Vitis rotundifolia TaxID=103349 RepID=A0AA39D883_VITRO|nr:hypothetical protein PVL29_026179 [Vitis rotundifolia]
MTVIDSKRRLCCLSLKPVLRFATMSSFPSSSQIMRGTTNSTSVSGSMPTDKKSTVESHSMLAAKENEDAEVEAK